MQAKLIQRYAPYVVFQQCSCSTHYSHLAVTTYDPTIISISLLPQQQARPTLCLLACLPCNNEHVDCIGIEIRMRVDIDTQTFSCVASPTYKLLVVRRVWSGTLLPKSSMRVGQQNALGHEVVVMLKHPNKPLRDGLQSADRSRSQRQRSESDYLQILRRATIARSSE